MRRGVAVARDRLLRPLPPTDADPFGATLRAAAQRSRAARSRSSRSPTSRSIGLLTGVEELPGFSALEESQPSERVRVALAAVDQAALDAAEAAGEELPPSLPALALTRRRRGDRDPGRAARVGRAAEAGLGAGRSS